MLRSDEAMAKAEKASDALDAWRGRLELLVWAVPLVASALTAVALHLGTLGNEFVWDDRVAVRSRPLPGAACRHHRESWDTHLLPLDPATALLAALQLLLPCLLWH